MRPGVIHRTPVFAWSFAGNHSWRTAPTRYLPERSPNCYIRNNSLMETGAGVTSTASPSKSNGHDDSSSGTPNAGADRAGPQAPAPRQASPKLWVRLVAFVAVLFAGWHILASFLWIAPFSANAREIVPGNALSSYMLPMFGQSWSVFAPEPVNGDFHFNVRAVLEDDAGSRSETGWVSATDVELSMIRYNLTPPRAGIQSTEVASNFKKAYDALTDTQRTIAAGDFTAAEWEVGLRAALENDAKNATDTTQADKNAQNVEEFLHQEHRSTAYATQVAEAVWGDEVVEVQYRVSRQNIIPFAERHNPQAQRPEATVVLPGWRALVVEEGQNSGNFADVFRRQFERISE